MVKFLSPWLTLVASFLETPHIYIKRLNMFGELSANLMDYYIDIRSTWINFVFDTNIVIENSVKDSDRTRYSQSRTIEFSYLARATSIPVDMDRFRASSNNTTKLPQLLREHRIDLPSCRCSTKLLVSGVGGESPQHCQYVHNATVTHLSDQDIDIEESDKHLVPQAVHASRVNRFELCSCHQTRMCFVLGILGNVGLIALQIY